MYVCVRVHACMCVWGRRSWEKRKKIKREKKEKRNEIENKNLFIQINRRTDRHKSFIHMRYYTEQYSKSNSIELNRIDSNRIESIWNKVG